MVASAGKSRGEGVPEKMRDLGYGVVKQCGVAATHASPRLLFSRTTLSKLPLLGTSLRRFVNHKFQDHRLRKILQYPAVFLSSQPKHIPAFYHLMSHADLTQGVRYPLGGFQEVVAALYRLVVAEGVQFRLGQEVTEIYVDDAGVQGVIR